MSYATVDAARGDLGSVWPEVERRLRAYLRSRDVPHHVAQDITQEVAARALARGVRFMSAADLYPWTKRVAANLVVDWSRSERRLVGGVHVDGPSPADVAHEVEGRLFARAVGSGLRALTDAERRALFSRTDGRANTGAVRRHRARRRLLALVEGGLAWLGVAWRALRRTSHPVVAAGAPALVLIAAAVLLPRMTAAPDATAPAADARVVAGPANAVATPRAAHGLMAVHGVGRAAATATAPPSRPHSRLVDVAAPGGGAAATVDYDDKPGTPPTLCVGGLPVPDFCIDRPRPFRSQP
jgi:hypothetical protein